MDWQEISGNWVLIPKSPVGIIHFLGGAFVAAAPHLTYRWLLEELGKKGYVIVATPFINSFDHAAIAQSAVLNLERTIERLLDRNRLPATYLPIYGLGHSMGCKLHLLAGSLSSIERAGNILLSYNNYPANRAIPFFEQFNISQSFDFEFSPSPLETNHLIKNHYQIRRNLLVQFKRDDLDQTDELGQLLNNRFPNMISRHLLPGTHLTPLGQDLGWNFNIDFIDTISSWFKGEIYRDLNNLSQQIIRWLQPY